MIPNDSEESGSNTVLSRRELLGASASLGTAALASATPGVGSVSAQSSTEPRIALGDDYTVDDDPNGNGDLVIEHVPSGNRFTYDASAGEWTAGEIKANSLNIVDLSVTNYGARAYLSANQSVSNNTVTKVQFDAETFDDQTEWDTKNYNFTAADSGKYQVEAQVRFASPGSDCGGQIRINVNGSMVKFSESTISSTLRDRTVSVADTIEIAAGDVVDVRVNQFSGGSLDIQSGSDRSAVSIVQEA